MAKIDMISVVVLGFDKDNIWCWTGKDLNAKS